MRIKRVKYLKDIETLLHALIDTKGNAVRGKVPRDANINRMLQQEVALYKKRLRTTRHPWEYVERVPRIVEECTFGSTPSARFKEWLPFFQFGKPIAALAARQIDVQE